MKYYKSIWLDPLYSSQLARETGPSWMPGKWQKLASFVIAI